MKSVAVLFARADSIYKTMPQCDVYDIERDARTTRGGRQYDLLATDGGGCSSSYGLCDGAAA